MRFLYVLIGALLGAILGLSVGAPTFHVDSVVRVYTAPHTLRMWDGLVCYYTEK